jgi:uncharacterized protein Yka (UPF0111/DUF47 family)
MTATLGLERLPRPIATLLDEAAANLLAVASELDALVHGDASSLDAIARGEDNGDRIVHDLIAAAGDSRRIGPDRAQLILLAQAVDDVVDGLETLARAWPHPPLPELADLLLALRDAARAAGHAVAAIEREAERPAWLFRCREREQEVRRLSRGARAWLLVEQPDPQLAIRGHNVLRQADAALRACMRLRVRLDSNGLA